MKIFEPHIKVINFIHKEFYCLNYLIHDKKYFEKIFEKLPVKRIVLTEKNVSKKINVVYLNKILYSNSLELNIFYGSMSTSDEESIELVYKKLSHSNRKNIFNINRISLSFEASNHIKIILGFI